MTTPIEVHRKNINMIKLTQDNQKIYSCACDGSIACTDTKSK